MIEFKEYKVVLEDLLKEIDQEIPQIQKVLVENKLPVKEFIKESNFPGVYAFYIKPKKGVEISDFSALWKDNDIDNYSKVVAGRFNKSRVISDGKELIRGKSS